MKKSIKKGFTLVELLVVIAIIAILSVVGIVGYVSFTNRARISNDTTIVTELNRVMQAEHVNKDVKNMQQIVNEVHDAGFILTKLTPTASKHHIVYDMEYDRFFLLDEKYHIVAGDPNYDKMSSKKWNHWKVVQSYDDVNGDEFSFYLGEIKNPDPSTVLEVSTGIDVGDNVVAGINYSNTNTDPDKGKDVVIRTNGGTLTIDAPTDTVKHYDAVESLNIIAVANASYHEHGQVKFVEISTGRIAIEAGAEVSHIHINAKEDAEEGENAFDEVIISYDRSVDLTEVGFSRDDVEIDEAKGTLVVALQSGTEEITTTTELDYVWLTKQGIYEQIAVSDNADTKENKNETEVEWVDTSDKSVETKDAAQKIANNIGATATVNETQYNVGVNEDRDIVLTTTNTETGQEEVAYTLETQANGSTILKDGQNESVESSVATVESVMAEAVEIQPDKEAVETGATLFAGGTGTEKDPFLIVDYDTMQHVTTVSKAMARASAVVASIGTSYDYNYYASFYGSYHASFGGYNTYDEYFETEWLPYKSYFDNPNSLSKYYFKVKDGISVIDCSEDSRKWIGVTLFGDFDGNGVTFKNLVGAPLFDGVSNLEARPTIIKNFNVDNCLIMTGSYYVGAVVRVCYYDVSFEDINISGYLEANSPASFLGQGNLYDRDCNISFTRCHSSMNLVSLSEQCGGFTGNLFGNHYNKNHLCTVNLVDSYFDGSLAVASGARFSYVECHTATPIKYSISYTSDELESQYASLYSTGHTEAKDVAYLGSTKTLTKGTISLPETGDVITIAKTAGAATAKAYIIVGLNPGNFTGIYVSEEIDLSGVSDSFSTNKVKNYDVIVNDGTHNKTEIVGNTLYIYDTRYESGYGSLTFMIVQYDSLGGIVSVSTKSK